ncbi:MAG: hypothetical protein KBG30_13730 [Bacteroidales bacterium]|nr:hypothetical protein [Bacteroidales bacterium]
MFKKSLITFLIISLLGINFSDILTVKAQYNIEDLKLEIPTLDVQQPRIPSVEEMESVISSAPESFEVSLAEMAVCNTGIYNFITDSLNSLKAIILNPVCQALGREVNVGGFGGTAISGMCTINVGGADSSQECKKWIQQKKATLKAKKAEMTKIALNYAAKAFADQLVSDTIDWIGGKEDKPQFITNWRDFFSDVTDEAVGRFIESSSFSALCEPFRFSVQIQTQTPGKPPFPTCTLSDVVNNIESFYEDFNNGGWLAFEEASYPWNNSIGAMVMIDDALNYEIQQAKEEAEKETQSGYEPTKYCIETITNAITGETECVKEAVSIPGDIKSDIASKAVTQQLDKTESYFLTESDLKNYGKMISDALVSRLIKSVRDAKPIGKKSYSQGLLGGYFLKEQTTPATTSLEIRYSCKNYDGSNVCEVDSDGEYFSKVSCQSNCSGFSVHYRCDYTNKICVRDDERGEYLDYDVCSNFCSALTPSISPTPTPSVSPTPTPTTSTNTFIYRCDRDAGYCVYDNISGEYSDLGVCNANCSL